MNRKQFLIKKEVTWDELIGQCPFKVHHGHGIRTEDPDCQIVHVDLMFLNSDGSAEGSNLVSQVPLDFIMVSIDDDHGRC